MRVGSFFFFVNYRQCCWSRIRCFCCRITSLCAFNAAILWIGIGVGDAEVVGWPQEVCTDIFHVVSHLLSTHPAWSRCLQCCIFVDQFSLILQLTFISVILDTGGSTTITRVTRESAPSSAQRAPFQVSPCCLSCRQKWAQSDLIRVWFVFDVKAATLTPFMCYRIWDKKSHVIKCFVRSVFFFSASKQI